MVREGVTGTAHGKGQPKILIRSASLKENTVWKTYDIKRHGLTLRFFVQQADSSLWLPGNPFTISLLLLLLPPLPGLRLNEAVDHLCRDLANLSRRNRPIILSATQYGAEKIISCDMTSRIKPNCIRS